MHGLLLGTVAYWLAIKGITVEVKKHLKCFFEAIYFESVDYLQTR